MICIQIESMSKKKKSLFFAANLFKTAGEAPVFQLKMCEFLSFFVGQIRTAHRKLPHKN